MTYDGGINRTSCPSFASSRTQKCPFAAECRLDWQPTGTGERVSGKVVGQAKLNSARFAMIDNGMGFRPVPWKDSLSKHLGQQIDGCPMPGGGIDWTLGRSRGFGL